MVAHNSEDILLDIHFELCKSPFFHTYAIFDLPAIVISMLVHVMLLCFPPRRLVKTLIPGLHFRFVPSCPHLFEFQSSLAFQTVDTTHILLHVRTFHFIPG